MIPVDSTVRALRAHFAQHNRRVLLLAGLTLFVAAGLWYVFYAVLFWITLLAMTSARGLDARLPEVLPALFIYAAGLLVLAAWIARRISPDEMPRDDKSAAEIVADFLLAVPRATLAVWGNLSAWQRLSAREFELAAALLERIRQERKLPVHSLPLEISGRATRGKIVFALQLVQLIEMRRVRGTAWLTLAPSASLARRPRHANPAPRDSRKGKSS